MRRIGRGLTVALAALLASGCVGGIKHNDVLLFGTDTKIALDVSASAAQGGAPGVTIGYKRVEAVWMPLVVNANGVNSTNLAALCEGDGCDADIDGAKYVGKGPDQREDAYSVFASFGSKLRGSTQGNAEVGIAQFFATGVAAQRLADNPVAALALSVQHPETGEAVGEAIKEQAIAEQLALANERVQAQATLSERAAECLAGNVDLIDEIQPTDRFPDDLRAQFVELVKRDPSSDNIRSQLRSFQSATTPLSDWLGEHCA